MPETPEAVSTPKIDPLSAAHAALLAVEHDSASQLGLYLASCLALARLEVGAVVAMRPTPPERPVRFIATAGHDELMTEKGPAWEITAIIVEGGQQRTPFHSIVKEPTPYGIMVMRLPGVRGHFLVGRFDPALVANDGSHLSLNLRFERFAKNTARILRLRKALRGARLTRAREQR